MNSSKKVASLFLLFGAELSAEILKLMPKESAQKILGALANLNEVSEKELSDIVEEFLPLLRKPKNFSGMGSAEGKSILEAAKKALSISEEFFASEEDIFIEQIREHLTALPNDVLRTWLDRERPQTVAVVLSLMDSETAARTLSQLQDNQRADICLAIAALRRVDKSALSALAEELGALRKASYQSGKSVGGKKILSKLFQNLDSENRDKLLEALAERNTDLAKELKQASLTLDQLSSLLPSHLAILCSKFSDRDLSLVLKTEGEDLRSKFYSSMSKNRAALLQEELSSLGPVKKSDVEAAKQKFIAQAENLRAENKIVFPWEEKLV